jgi:hypothetical protein
MLRSISVLAALCHAVLAPSAPVLGAERLRSVYAASWLGLPLGRITYDVDYENGHFSIVSTMATGGVAAIFDDTKFTARATGMADHQSVRWTTYELDHSYAKKFRRTQMTVRPTGVEVVITPRYSNLGDPPATPGQINAARDPLSTMLAVAHLAASRQTCAQRFPVFDGRFRYDLVGADLGRREVHVGDYKGQVLRCRVQYVPVAGFNEATREEAPNLPMAEFWLGIDAKGSFAAPVRVAIPTPIGSAVAALKTLQVTTP